MLSMFPLIYQKVLLNSNSRYHIKDTFFCKYDPLLQNINKILWCRVYKAIKLQEMFLQNMMKISQINIVLFRNSNTSHMHI